eukprot:tig00021591_g22799.t1
MKESWEAALHDVALARGGSPDFLLDFRGEPELMHEFEGEGAAGPGAGPSSIPPGPGPSSGRGRAARGEAPPRAPGPIEKLERFIGVIYRPKTERWSHMSAARIARQARAPSSRPRRLALELI